MTRSATACRAVHRRSAPAPLAPGFTLIELLVVVTIIGIMAGVVGFNMMADDPSREVRREAERFVLVMRQAVDEATFNQQQLGLYLEEDSYHFGRWEMLDVPDEDSASNPGLSGANASVAANPGGSTSIAGSSVNSQLNRMTSGAKPPKRIGKWQPAAGSRALRDYTFPEHVRVILEVPESDLLTNLTVKAESRLTQTTLNLADIGPEIDEEPGLDPPDVYVLSSGEVTPFRATLYYVQDSTLQVRLEADALGNVRILDHDEL